MLNARTLTALLAVAALAAAGCGSSSSTGNPAIDSRNQVDAAYEAVAAAQVANADAYSKTIVKSTTANPKVKAFAQQVIEERTAQEDLLARLRRTGDPVSVTKASHTLDISLDDLAINADGTPLAAPSSDAGYLKAMKSNLNGSMRAAAVQLDSGGPGTAQLSNRITATATAELEQIKQLQQ